VVCTGGEYAFLRSGGEPFSSSELQHQDCATRFRWLGIPAREDRYARPSMPVLTEVGEAWPGTRCRHALRRCRGSRISIDGPWRPCGPPKTFRSLHGWRCSRSDAARSATRASDLDGRGGYVLSTTVRADGSQGGRQAGRVQPHHPSNAGNGHGRPSRDVGDVPTEPRTISPRSPARAPDSILTGRRVAGWRGRSGAPLPEPDRQQQGPVDPAHPWAPDLLKRGVTEGT